jgi:hypothetical protein
VGCNGARFPDETDFVQKFLSIKFKFVFDMRLPLVNNPLPKQRHVFLVPRWHETMSILTFILDQLFILLPPFTVKNLDIACRFINSPNEPDFVQTSLSIKSNCVFDVKLPLCMNPNPKRRVFLVPTWHETMAIFAFKLDQLFILLVPFSVIKFRHGSRATPFRFVAFCLLEFLIYRREGYEWSSTRIQLGASVLFSVVSAEVTILPVCWAAGYSKREKWERNRKAFLVPALSQENLQLAKVRAERETRRTYSLTLPERPEITDAKKSLPMNDTPNR